MENKKKSKPIFSNEFKADALKLAESSSRPVTQIARELGVSEGALRQWIRNAVKQNFSSLSIRKVVIPPHILPVIKSHLDNFVKPGLNSPVITGINGGPLRAHVLQKHWARARKSIGREDLHFHDLRRTGNTIASATGASTKEITARMGHSSSRAALIYQRSTRDRDRVITNTLSSIADSANEIESPHM